MKSGLVNRDSFPSQAVFRSSRANLFRDDHLGPELDSVDVEEFLFAVLNPSETVVQLGLALTGDSRLTLYYTDVSMHITSQRLTTFRLPAQAKGAHGWLR